MSDAHRNFAEAWLRDTLDKIEEEATHFEIEDFVFHGIVDALVDMLRIREDMQ